MFSNNVFISDVIAAGLSVGITVSLLKLLEQTATRGVFEQVDASKKGRSLTIRVFMFLDINHALFGYLDFQTVKRFIFILSR